MENRATVIRKVRTYVERTYGDASEEAFRKAFDACDEDHDGKCSLDEIRAFLKLAGVGASWIARSVAAKGILKELDTNGDDAVEWTEFHAVFTA